LWCAGEESNRVRDSQRKTQLIAWLDRPAGGLKKAWYILCAPAGMIENTSVLYESGPHAVGVCAISTPLTGHPRAILNGDIMGIRDELE
jgi:hypothetical protein